jgi:hypothetical protein
MVDLDSLVIFDPGTRTLYGARELQMSMNGTSLQLTLPNELMSLSPEVAATPKKPRKASAYSKKYGKAFKKVSPKFKKKNGEWKKNGFRLAVQAAHKLAKK